VIPGRRRPAGSSSPARTALDVTVTLAAALGSAGILWWVAGLGRSGDPGPVARLAEAAVGVLGVASLVLFGLFMGLIVLAERVLGLDWKTPGLLNLTCVFLGAAAFSSFGATFALVMAGFAGPPAVTTTIGFVTVEGGSGWSALDRLAQGALRLLGWTLAFILGTVAILAWLGVVVGLGRLLVGRLLPGRAGGPAAPR
jgi:hypothetical protein